MSRLKVESDLRRAIESDQLRVEYQPYFRLADGTPAGVEALVRWQHPERGLISPGDFIPVAEESGLIAAARRVGAAPRLPRPRRLARRSTTGPPACA